MRNALFKFANKFYAGLEKIALENKLPAHLMLRYIKLGSNFSKVWEYGEHAEIPCASRFFSTDENVREAEIKKFKKQGSTERILCD